jgi:hypothetical protein
VDAKSKTVGGTALYKSLRFIDFFFVIMV